MKDPEIFDTYSDFPLLIPDESLTKWEGYITEDVEAFRVVIHTPCYPSLEGLVFECENELRLIISDQLSNVMNCQTLLGFLQRLVCTIGENSKKSLSVVMDELEIEDRKSILMEMKETFDENNVVDMDKGMNWIKLKYDDSTGYTHTIKIQIGNGLNRKNCSILEADLPDAVLPQFEKIHSVRELYLKFTSVVELLVPFWIEMDKLGSEVWIVDPLIPTKSSVHRRIVVSDSLSMLLTFNPLSVTSMPDIKLLGSFQLVDVKRTLYKENYERFGWDIDSDIIDNFKCLLEIHEFPRKPDPKGEENESNECFICFDNSLEGEPAQKWCPNPKCSSFYHITCLIEWLDTVPTGKAEFDEITGPCPHCDEKLSCPRSSGESNNKVDFS